MCPSWLKLCMWIWFPQRYIAVDFNLLWITFSIWESDESYKSSPMNVYYNNFIDLQNLGSLGIKLGRARCPIKCELLEVWSFSFSISCWSWNSSTLATWCEELTHWKRPWYWERLKAGGEGDNRGWDGWKASLTQWTWVWVNSGSWWWTGRPGVLQSMGSHRVGHDWVAELNLTEA